MQIDKKVKLFISHSSKDEKYVDAIVDLLFVLGIKEPEQMFCSSCPPFDVMLNDDIFEILITIGSVPFVRNQQNHLGRRA